MFDIGWSELLVIGVVAIVVVGPKELPRLMRTFGQYTGKLRAMANDFQRQFEDAVRDSEIDEVRKAMQDVQAQASDVSASVTTSKPLMVPKPAAPAPAAAAAEASPAPKAKAKPRAKKTEPGKPKVVPAKSATPKAASAVTTPPKKPASAKPASAKTRRAKTPEEGAS